MSVLPLKNHPTIGCCGLDCGLCPRYYTVGRSRCPGCGGPDFLNKHPSCSYVTCCVKRNRLEVCAQCSEFPCLKFDSWLETGGDYDSFLTHKNAKPNQDFIRTYGLERFIEQQRTRILLLEEMLQRFNDGRSKSFYCIAATLLPIPELDTALEKTEQHLTTNKINEGDARARARILKEILNETASRHGVVLRLRKKGVATS